MARCRDFYFLEANEIKFWGVNWLGCRMLSLRWLLLWIILGISTSPYWNGPAVHLQPALQEATLSGIWARNWSLHPRGIWMGVLHHTIKKNISYLEAITHKEAFIKSSTKSILAFCFDLINFYCYTENKSFELEDIVSFLQEYWYSQGNMANFRKKTSI